MNVYFNSKAKETGSTPIAFGIGPFFVGTKVMEKPDFLRKP